MAFINNLAYEASAGSGKTFMLVVRYLSLLFQGAHPCKILALTFTNKAASEMQERIVETLEELEHRGELEEIMKVTELSREYLLKQRPKILHEFLNAHTKIMTIDSFFTQILRKFSLYASLMPDFSTFSAQHELKLMSRFLAEVSVANKRESLISLSLDSKKRMGDIFELLEQFYIKKEELSHIHFTKADPKKYEKEIHDAFHALASLVHNSQTASATAKKSLVAESFEDILSKSWLERETLHYRTFAKCFVPEMDSYLHTIQNALKNYMRAREQNFFYALHELVEIYQKAKKALYIQDSELSFSDVTSLVYEILHRLDDSEFLYFRLDSTIEHMLLDEFQDTSILQYKILNPLIKEITSGSGVFENGSFFFVGDVKQSIYRFRGGVSALFGEVAREHNTVVEKLRVNYRSQRKVVEFVNEVFGSKIKNYTPQEVQKGVEGGYVEVMQNDEPLQESLSCVKYLLEMGADADDIAVLCATNGDGEALKNLLSEHHIEVVTETTTKLINQRSVQAVLEYLKYLYFKEDIYRHNFFALIGEQSRFVAFVDFNKLALLDIVQRVIEQYKLFYDEFHLIRFLDIVAKYTDIEALLFEYERIDAEAAASDLSGVRVLTVHKSKGLEYKHVIVMDRLKNPPSPRNTIIYEYEGITLQNIYLRTQKRAGLDSAYARALQKESELVQEDALNALYVAFTRAKENLFIIKKTQKSMFDLLDLEVGKQGVLSCTKKSIAHDKAYPPVEYKALYYGTQSDILAQQESHEEDLKAIHFGLAMHYMLEMLGAFQIDNIADAKHMMLNKYGHLLDEEEVQDIQARVTSLLKDAKFQKLVEGECFREKALKYKNNLRYIDLLVQHRDGWRVIDYKSSTTYAKEHKKQVRYYLKAIQAITSQKVQGYICYLLEDKIEFVEVAAF